MPATDEDAALDAIAALQDLSGPQKQALDSINGMLGSGEPFVDVHHLFGLYNILYFRSLLVPRVEVIWSPRLTLCAGTCELSRDPETRKFTRIRLKLSSPLLQYRPRSDTVNTLLHEAIHAYFFITTSWRHSRGDDGTGHGVGFQLLADAINNHGNYDITIYHTFHDEVDSYRTHVWQCDGPCRQKPPYFGLVKRSMNRAPGQSDTWWAQHGVECGGTYVKIQEPELTKKQRESLSKKERAGLQRNKLDSWVNVGKKQDASSAGKTSEQLIAPDEEDEISFRKSGAKRKLETVVVDDIASNASRKILKANDGTQVKVDDDGVAIAEKLLVQCPICSLRVAESRINQHLDVVHPP